MYLPVKFFGLFLLTLMTWPVAAQENRCALILMHGKWDRPQSLTSFGNKLESVCDFKSIEMPWSRRRNYDASYPTAISEIKAQVAAFRQSGYKKVILVGHSFGANAAIAYMATEADVDGIVPMAPGHSPEHMYKQGIGRAAVDRAKNLISAGKGDERLDMEDLAQGTRFSVSMSANILFSYFDPNGLGHIPASAANFKKSVPVLWVIGTADPLFSAGSNFAFDKMAQNDASRYIVVNANHFNTPDMAFKQVLFWLKSLP